MVVAVYELSGVGRSRVICEAFAAGLKRVGEAVIRLKAEAYRAPEADVAVFYGYTAELQRAMADYRRTGVAVYVDLGYFGRHDGGRRAGFHKVSVNGRHPTAYFQRRAHGFERVQRFRLKIAPWRRGKSILLAGMSAKAAKVEGFAAEEWERAAIDALRTVTDRPIVYRPKPNWPGARPITGTAYSAPGEPLEAALAGCHAVVSHHSNVLIDGLLAGVPAFCRDGIALPLACNDLTQIETPRLPDGRAQWAADIAFTQWNVAEMAQGLPWRHLKDEGLIP